MTITLATMGHGITTAERAHSTRHGAGANWAAQACRRGGVVVATSESVLKERAHELANGWQIGSPASAYRTNSLQRPNDLRVMVPPRSTTL